MKIGISYSLKPVDAGDEGPDDRFEEFDKPETVEAIAAVIRSEGHDVSLLGDGRDFLSKILSNQPDFVFNIAEGQGTGRNRESHVPSACEMLGIPYSGSDPLTLAIALDKGLASRLLRSQLSPDLVNFPGTVAIPHDISPELARRDYLEIQFASCHRFPVILKPALEGSSKGIRADCIADDLDQAVELFTRLARDYQQPIVVENFISGQEVTVGVLGNGSDARVIGVLRVVPNVTSDRFVYSLEVKRDWRNQVTYEAPALLPQCKPGSLEAAAVAVYQALGCRDFARIDFRVDQAGQPFFIEANPLPGLAPITSDLVILAEGYGISHAELIRRILHIALDRVGLGSK